MTECAMIDTENMKEKLKGTKIKFEKIDIKDRHRRSNIHTIGIGRPKTKQNKTT